MKVLVIQPKIGMGDMVIYLPYIHAISKKYQTPVSILVKENSRANQLLAEDKHIKEINDDLDYEKYVEYAKEQNADHLIETQQSKLDAFDDDIPF